MLKTLSLAAGLMALVTACSDRANPTVRPSSPSITIDPTYRLATPAGQGSNDDEAIRFLEAKLALDRNGALIRAELAAAYLQKARQNHDHTLVGRAEELANESLERLRYGNTTAVLVLAKIAQDEHDFVSALRLADEVLQSDASSDGALAIRTTATMGLGRPLEALQHATLWVKQQPCQAAFAHRGVLFASIGQSFDALADFRRALALDMPGARQESAWTRAAIARHYLKAGEVASAYSFAREALRVAPDSTFALAVLADIEMRSGNLDSAIDLGWRLHERTGDGRWLANNAAVFAKRGQQRLAERTWKVAEREMAHRHGDGTIGHARDLAKLLLDRGASGDEQRALYLMLAEITRRQDADTRLILIRALLANGYPGRALTELNAMHRSGYAIPTELASIEI